MAEPSPSRRSASRLARLSFRDGERAAALLTGPSLSWWDEQTNTPVDDRAAAVIAAIGRTADPDAALAAVSELAATDEGTELRAALAGRAEVRARLLPLVAVSTPLAEHLIAHPPAWRALVGPADLPGMSARLHAAVGADAAVPTTGTGGTRATITGAEAALALRAAYRRELVAIAGRDLSGELGLRAVTSALADLAGYTLQAALAVAAAELPDGSEPCRLAVIAMGKTGGRELNYVSDVDVVFVAEPGEFDGADVDTEKALRSATHLAGHVMRLCREVAWEVDAALRPEGKDGPLVRTLASHEAYYQRWASTWEFQALLKARAVAGDLELGARYEAAIGPLVWSAAERPDFVADVQAMRRRVVAHIPPAVADREIKLGPGGLRDVEFAVQLLQLVHGRGRGHCGTHVLGAQAATRLLGDDELTAGELGEAVRAVAARTHTVPGDEAEAERYGHMLGRRFRHLVEFDPAQRVLEGTAARIQASLGATDA